MVPRSPARRALTCDVVPSGRESLGTAFVSLCAQVVRRRARGLLWWHARGLLGLLAVLLHPAQSSQRLGRAQA
eukprot:10027725-Lingulodinium_polyedra.AAC.1